jgi:myo-inositol-1-phosphate synthase
MGKRRVGIWLIGAKGSVAATTLLGLSAIKKGLAAPTGLVTELPQFQHLDLVSLDELVVGGHEIRNVCLVQAAAQVAAELSAAGRALVDQCREELAEIDRRVRPGTLANVGPTIAGLADLEIPAGESARQTIDRLQADLRQFSRTTGAERVVVVNLASTEPAFKPCGLPATWTELAGSLSDVNGAAGRLPASSLYAIAALDLGHAYVNFTPSLGAAPAAIGQLACLRGGCHCGCDGKTGETLVKSALGPMFARRNLQVLSWVGHNIFGNMDGRVLDDPANKQTKISSKDHLLGQILGYQPQTHVSIEYIRSLGEWKTAWDHIHFAGFLGTPMTMQFIWQGCDSLLAAPLVLDLIRLTELAAQRGETGLLRFLASFFKSPLGVEQQGFDCQFRMLEEWAQVNTQ